MLMSRLLSQIATQKGTPTTPGTASPYRDRPIEESLALFEQMNTPEAVEGKYGASCEARYD